MIATSWHEHREQIAEVVAKPRFGLFSDLDGTLAPIAITPGAANISERTRQLLAALRDALPVVVLISGRRADSLAAKVGLPGIVYIGNHGLDELRDGKNAVRPEAIPYLPKLQAVRAGLLELEEDGAFVEDKEATLSFHYRQVPDPQAFATRVAGRVAEMVEKHGLAMFKGKRVFEVRPPIEMDKGLAMRKLAREHQLESALFLGDDMTDLHALTMARQLREGGECAAWGVGVQSVDAPPALAATADFLAADVADVEEMLSFILTARKASST